MDVQLNKLFTNYFIKASTLFATVLIRTYIKKDFMFMKKQYVKDCNLWCKSHFIMYILLGYYSPKYWYISFIISILWEYIEAYLEKYGVYIRSNIVNDVITNTLGLVLGIGIRCLNKNLNLLY